MRYFFALFRFFFSIYGFALFLLGMFIVFPFSILASFFGKIRGGNLIYNFCTRWAQIALYFWGIFHKNSYESPIQKHNQYVFVFNHISYMDIPVLLISLKGHPIRVLGKAEMAKIPIFGFIYKNAAIMVERGNQEKRAKSVQQLKAVIRKGISIVIAPEGTFNMTDNALKNFYDGAFRIAIETQTPIKPMLFLDTNDRLDRKSIFTLNPGRSRTIFLDEVSVDGLNLEDVPYLREKVYGIMERKLIEYKASWIKNNRS